MISAVGYAPSSVGIGPAAHPVAGTRPPRERERASVDGALIAALIAALIVAAT
jgi:hypothetical protein